MVDIIIYDDDETIWGTYGIGAGTKRIVTSEELTEKVIGTSSTKCIVDTAGSVEHPGFQGGVAAQNWSLNKKLHWWFYGANTGNSWRFQIQSSNSNHRRYYWTDNSTGWRLITATLSAPDQTQGTCDMGAINNIKIYGVGLGAQTIYFDRMLVDGSLLLLLVP